MEEVRIESLHKQKCFELSLAFNVFPSLQILQRYTPLESCTFYACINGRGKLNTYWNITEHFLLWNTSSVVFFFHQTSEYCFLFALRSYWLLKPLSTGLQNTMDAPASNQLSSRVLTRQNYFSFCPWLFTGLAYTKTIILIIFSQF